MVERIETFDQVRYLVLASQREGNRVLGSWLSKIGLTTSQAEVLSIVDRHGVMNLKELGGYLICEDASPSRLVASMVSKGWLSSSVNATDKRAIDLSLTEIGQKLASQVASIEADLNKQFDTLNADELLNLSQLLRKLISKTEAIRKIEKRFPTNQ